MPSETISVVIPAFNAEKFLAEALGSVFAQARPAAEIVVVDDGSTDATPVIVGKYPAARLISLPHSGVSVARNAGVAATTGDFIAFLDADDIWEPEKLALQIAMAEAEPAAGIVMCRQSYRFDSEIPNWFRGPRDGSSEAGYMPSNWLLRRSTWARVGQFAAETTHSEDTDWLARASDAGVQIVMVDRPLVVHRIHGANASGQAAAVRTGVLQALRDSVRRKQELDK